MHGAPLFLMFLVWVGPMPVAVGEDVIEVLLVMRTGMGNVTEEASLLAAQDVNAEPGILPNYKFHISPVYLEVCNNVHTVCAWFVS